MRGRWCVLAIDEDEETKHLFEGGVDASLGNGVMCIF